MKAIALTGLIVFLTHPVSFSNIIADPGFESGSPSGLWGGSSVVATDQRAGNYAAKLGETTQSGGGYEKIFTGLTPRTSYTFSAGVRTVGGSARIGVKEYGGAQVTKTYDSGNYLLQEVTFTTGASNTSAKCFIWNNPGDATVVYTDDLSLKSDTVVSVGYDLIFSDEFDTNGPIDLTKWVPEVGFKRNNEDQYYRAENLSQSGGDLVITAKREQFLNANYKAGSNDWRQRRQYANWTSGSINTKDKFDFLYGRIVCRAKVTNLTGTWPAIWTVGGGEWPSTGEINIMENYGGNIFANFATAGDGRYKAVWDSYKKDVSSFPAGWTNGYHVWELEWSPSRAVILLDGVEMNAIDPSKKNRSGSYSFPDVAPFQNFGQLLWLNLAIGGAGGSTAALPDETHYLVDYIRVYQGAVPTH